MERFRLRLPGTRSSRRLLVIRNTVQYFPRQAARLGPEEQRIVLPIIHFSVETRRAGGESQQPWRLDAFQKALEAGVRPRIRPLALLIRRESSKRSPLVEGPLHDYSGGRVAPDQ
jgi:hypothetical protein